MMDVKQWIAGAVLASSVAMAQDATVLQDFEAADAGSRFRTLDTKAELVEHNGGHALKVVSGTSNPYPNVNFEPPGGKWDLSKHERVEMDITNTSAESVKFGMRVDNPGATGKANNNTGGITLDPGETGTIVVEIERDVAGKLREDLIGLDRTPWGKRGEQGGPIDPSNVVKINLFLNKPDRSYSFVIDNLRATGTYDASKHKVPDPFFPFIDTYGQYIHQDWPGKVKSDADLLNDKKAEAASISEFPRPADWNTYGGWARGPKLDATGHFHTAKHEGKWYLVDPEGRLYFSMGMAVVQAGGETAIDRRDGWFADAPWEKPEFKKFVSKKDKNILRGDYQGQQPRTFSFIHANLQRKYGEQYESAWNELITQRLMNWGFNSMGNWSEPELFKTTTIPYTHWVFNDGPKLPWRQNVRKRVPDPFDPKFDEVLRRRANTMTRGTVDDPKCIGYFVDNEIQWGTETSLAETTLLGDDTSSAKQEFVKDLTAKYGDIAKLNTAWKTSYESWDTLLKTKAQNVKALPAGPGVEADFKAFSEKTARAYFAGVKKVLKDVAPNKLYLGCRFAEYNPMVVRVAAEYCDVVSFNLYRDTVAKWTPPSGIDKPIIIGEFHFGATDRGVFGDGLVGAASTQDRAEKFKRYVTGAAANPYIVGAHWFQLCDEPTTGRVSDGENHNVGFLAITDRPYQEMIEASRSVANSLYSTRAGTASK